MPENLLEASLDLFERSGSNILGLAGGEPTEYPDFWNVLNTIRERSLARGYAVRVATNGVSIDDNQFILALIRSLYSSIMFQITIGGGLYPPLSNYENISDTKNIKIRDLTWLYKSKKCVGRNFLPPYGIHYRSKGTFCRTIYKFKSMTRVPISIGRFVRMYEGLDGACSLHIHPDGEVRLGPLDCCKAIGNVESFSLDADMYDLLGDGPCKRCKVNKDGTESDFLDG